MRKHIKGNVSWVGYIDWELESFHGDDVGQGRETAPAEAARKREHPKEDPAVRT